MNIDTQKLTEALTAQDAELAALLPASDEVATEPGIINIHARYDGGIDTVSLRFSLIRPLNLRAALTSFLHVDNNGDIHLLALGATRMGSTSGVSGDLARKDIRRLYGGQTLAAWVLVRPTEGEPIQDFAEVQIPR